jgi:hypothetical protein
LSLFEGQFRGFPIRSGLCRAAPNLTNDIFGFRPSLIRFGLQGDRFLNRLPWIDLIKDSVPAEREPARVGGGG